MNADVSGVKKFLLRVQCLLYAYSRGNLFSSSESGVKSTVLLKRCDITVSDQQQWKPKANCSMNESSEACSHKYTASGCIKGLPVCN